MRSRLFCVVSVLSVVLACGAAGVCAQEVPLEPLEPLEPSVSGSPAGLEQVVTFRFGASYHLLDRPEDQGGDTILAGSAFTGPGFVLGLSYGLWELLPSLGLEVGLLYQHATATGFEQRGEMAREVLLTADILSMPWTVRGRVKVVEALHLLGGVGFDLALGLKTAAEVREQNIPAREQLFLQTRSVTTFALAANAGVELDVGQVRLPLEVRFSWNPAVGATTPERFDSYVSPESRGQYRVEFTYTILFMLGVAYAL